MKKEKSVNTATLIEGGDKVFAKYRISIQKPNIEYLCMDLQRGKNYRILNTRVRFPKHLEFQTTSEKQDAKMRKKIAYFTVKAVILKAVERKYKISFKNRSQYFTVLNMPYYTLIKL